MKSFICLAAMIACVWSQEESLTHADSAKYPQLYSARSAGRHPRDVKDLPGSWPWEKTVGQNGKIFGTLGQDASGLFGKAGYKHQIFNDDRGKLNAQAYGSRVLGPNGDSTNFGGKLDWADKNAKAAIDLSKSVGGHTALKATGQGVWNPDKNTHVSAGGFYEQPFLGHGRPDYGVQAEFKKDF